MSIGIVTRVASIVRKNAMNDWIFISEKRPKVGQLVVILDMFDREHLAKLGHNIYAKDHLVFRLIEHDRVVLELDEVCCWVPVPKKPKKGE